MCIFDVVRLFRNLALNSSLLRWAFGLWVFCSLTVLNPRLFGAPPPPSHTQAHSLWGLSLLSLDIQLTFASPEFWKLPLGQMQIQDRAEQKRDFLLHLPSLEPLVLLFQSLLNSKWGDCFPSDGHRGIYITELAVSLQFYYQLRNRLDFLWWCFSADILELALKQFIPPWNGSCPVILLDLYLLGFNYRVKGWVEKKAEIPTAPKLSSIKTAWLPQRRPQEYIYIVTVLFSFVWFFF